MPPQRFTGELWSGIEATYEAILVHPFIVGLTDGSLERASFQCYVVQDAHYLREYAWALSVAAARAPAATRSSSVAPTRSFPGSSCFPSVSRRRQVAPGTAT